MDFIAEILICKAKSIVSSLCSIILWASTLPSSMHSTRPKPLDQTHHIHKLGLKTLIYSSLSQNPYPRRSPIIHSYMVSKPPPPPPPPPSYVASSSSFQSPTYSTSDISSTMDDLIGTDSGVYLSSNDDEMRYLEAAAEKRPIRPRINQCCAMTKQYPPPIPLLAQTGNLPGRMPWILTRHYVDGRLILKEVRIKHHEYFKARRENGRLVLTLVPLNDGVPCCHEEDDDKEVEDLQFAEEVEVEEERETEEERESESVEEEEEEEERETAMLASKSVPKAKWELEREGERSREGEERKWFTYNGEASGGGGKWNSLCNMKAANEHGRVFFSQPGSSPLRPMATVV